MAEIKPQNISMWSRLGPNGALGIAALELGESCSNATFLTADLGTFSGLARFAASFPDRFYNVGIAEQNMIGIAAGMAAEGKLPYAVTYSTFAVLRCADQIKTWLAETRLNVRIIGVAAGLSIAINGPSHIGFEDIAVIRAMPGIAILSPADCTEIVKSVLASADYPGAAYIRLTGSLNMPIVYRQDYDFEIGRAIVLREGGDIALIATGSMVHESLGAADILKEKGISATVINMHTIRPMDTGAIDKVCTYRLIATVEEHSSRGGLGGAVAEYISQKAERPRLLRIGLREYPEADTYKNLLTKCGLTADGIASRILEIS